MVKLEPETILGEREAADLAPLALAYIGDTVFDLFVRTRLVQGRAGNVNTLHKKSAAVVNARAQAAFAHRVEAGLTELEHNIFMRGRNAKSATVPKNMSIGDYRYATAAEALVGYLYLTGQGRRICELFEMLAFDTEEN